MKPSGAERATQSRALGEDERAGQLRVHGVDRLFGEVRTRLEGETIRDSVLAASGQLQASDGGPGVFVDVPADVAQGFEFFNQGYAAAIAWILFILVAIVAVVQIRVLRSEA